MPRGRKKKSHAEFIAEVNALVGKEYEVLREYKGSNSKIKLRHAKCRHEYEVLPTNFLRGDRCPKCAGHMKRTTETFKQEVSYLVGNEYEVLGEYINSRVKIKLRHTKCYHEYEATPDSFLRGKRCPKCNESKGERAIADTFAALQVSYEAQFKFKDCRYKRPLPFDFAVFNIDKTLKCLIEYDGEQHFVPKGVFGGQEGFNTRKHCDAIKTQYCADHNIPLIRIPYWEFDNIDEILTKELRKLGVIETEAIAS